MNAAAVSTVVPAPPSPWATVVWLAVADARGHLMRAHLARGVLAKRGVAVHVITTSREGSAFLAAMGTPAEVLSTEYAVAFDDRQNLDRAATDRCVIQYVSGHAARDTARLRALLPGADLLVNDFHPLPLVRPRGLGAPVVHVYGTHLWHAIAHHFEGRTPRALDRAGAAIAVRLRDRAFARIEHSLRAPSGSTATLPSIVAAPARGRAEIRAALGLGGGQRLAAVYLNPHFRDASLAAALESALARSGFRMHAVGEGYAGRPGWRAFDPRFNDVAAAADVLVSAPGMGALSAWACFGTPLLALRTDQPEQERNVAELALRGAAPYATVNAHAPVEALERALRALVATLRGPRPDPARVAEDVQARWADAICALVERARRNRRRP